MTSLESDLVGCLEDMIPPQENVASPHVEVIILDGAAITNMLAPGGGGPCVTMLHRFSCRTSHLSYSMQSEWMSSGMNTCQSV